ncbi:hypothetical protein BDW71DRAFT_189625 [Aspergillus fruticulosus]
MLTARHVRHISAVSFFPSFLLPFHSKDQLPVSFFLPVLLTFKLPISTSGHSVLIDGQQRPQAHHPLMGPQIYRRPPSVKLEGHPPLLRVMPVLISRSNRLTSGAVGGLTKLKLFTLSKIGPRVSNYGESLIISGLAGYFGNHLWGTRLSQTKISLPVRGF